MGTRGYDGKRPSISAAIFTIAAAIISTIFLVAVLAQEQEYG
ncbi:MAG: hypothetical protein QXX99_02045 [Candidatus Bathyarchaeia archaeon]